MPSWRDFGAFRITSRLACPHFYLEPRSANCSALANTGLNKLSSLYRCTSSFKAALYGKLLWMYVSLGLRLKPQNLPSHNEWSPNWWGIRAFKFSCSLFGLQHFWQKYILNTFVYVKCLAELYTFFCMKCIETFPNVFQDMILIKLFFFKEILSSFLMRDIKGLSPFPSKHSIGVPWTASFFTQFNPPVLPMNLALPVCLHTQLCFLTGRPGLFLCNHLHTPQVLWLTTVLTTFLPYSNLLIKRVWANKILKEIKSSKCIRQ